MTSQPSVEPNDMFRETWIGCVFDRRPPGSAGHLGRSPATRPGRAGPGADMVDVGIEVRVY